MPTTKIKYTYQAPLIKYLTESGYEDWRIENIGGEIQFVGLWPATRAIEAFIAGWDAKPLPQSQNRFG